MYFVNVSSISASTAWFLLYAMDGSRIRQTIYSLFVGTDRALLELGHVSILNCWEVWTGQEEVYQGLVNVFAKRVHSRCAAVVERISLGRIFTLVVALITVRTSAGTSCHTGIWSLKAQIKL